MRSAEFRESGAAIAERFSYCRESGAREFFCTDGRAVRAALQTLQKADSAMISDSEKLQLSKIGEHALVKWARTAKSH